MAHKVYTGHTGEDLANKVEKYLDNHKDMRIDSQSICSDGHMLHLSVSFTAKEVKPAKKKATNDNTRRSK